MNASDPDLPRWAGCQPRGSWPIIEAEGKAAAMKVLARAEADRIMVVSDALDKACPTAGRDDPHER